MRNKRKAFFLPFLEQNVKDIQGMILFGTALRWEIIKSFQAKSKATTAIFTLQLIVTDYYREALSGP